MVYCDRLKSVYYNRPKSVDKEGDGTWKKYLRANTVF